MNTKETKKIFEGLPRWPSRGRRSDADTTMDWGAPRVLDGPPTEQMRRKPRRIYPPTEPMLRLPGLRVATAVAAGVAAGVVPVARAAVKPVELAFVEPGPIPRFLEWLFAGGVAGLMVGWIDGYWAATRSGLETLSVSGYRSTIILAVLLAVVGCSLLAAVTWPFAAALYRRNIPAQALGLGKRFWKPLAMVGSAAAVAFVIWGQYVGLQWAAIDIRLPVLIAVDLAVFFAVRYGVRNWPDGGVATGLFGLAGALVILTAGYYVLPDGRSEALTRLGGESAASGKFLLGARFLADADGDGHPAGLCVEDCDCDDSNDAIHPGARDIVDNGIDEDCDGIDATSADRAAYAALVDKQMPSVVATTAAPPPRNSSDLVLDLDVADATGTKTPNIVFIVVDTLRADHLGHYGYKRPVSPNLDALAERGVVFDQARATGPQTRFSVPPMLTGKYFTEIERTTGGWPAVRLKEKLIAERLAERGYQTAAVHSIAYFKKWSGMAQGMETHNVRCAKGRTSRSSDCVTDETLKWFDTKRDANRPFFLWAYYGDPHAPYLRHDEVPGYGNKPADIYDQEVQFTDMHIGRLMQGMKARGVDVDNTYFVVTSDHGEGLDTHKDHGHLYHGATLFDEVIRVPLLIAGPGFEAGRVQTPVSLLDLTPTFMFLLLRGSVVIERDGEQVAVVDEPDTFIGHLSFFTHGERTATMAEQQLEMVKASSALLEPLGWFSIVWMVAYLLYVVSLGPLFFKARAEG